MNFKIGDKVKFKDFTKTEWVNNLAEVDLNKSEIVYDKNIIQIIKEVSNFGIIGTDYTNGLVLEENCFTFAKEHFENSYINVNENNFEKLQSYLFDLGFIRGDNTTDIRKFEEVYQYLIIENKYFWKNNAAPDFGKQVICTEDLDLDLIPNKTLKEAGDDYKKEVEKWIEESKNIPLEDKLKWVEDLENFNGNIQKSKFDQLVKEYSDNMKMYYPEKELEGQKFSEDKLPIYTVLFKQFPLAIQEVVKCSLAGHKKYPNDIDWMNFKRVPDAENQYKNAALRHMFEEGINKDMLEYGKILSDAQVVWNLMASLQIKLENDINK